MFNRIFTLVRKELSLLFRDKASRLTLIMPVLLQVLIFPFAATLDVTNTSIAIDNQDSGALSTELVQRLSKASVFSKTYFVQSTQEIEQHIDHQNVLLAVRIPADFSRHILANQPAQVQIIADGRNANSAQIASQYVQQVMVDFQRSLLGQASSEGLVVRHWYNPNLNYKWFVLPSLVALITTIGILIVTSLSVAREREEGTLDQLLVAPIQTWQIFIGKAVPAVIVATLQGSIVLWVSVMVYQIPFQGAVWLFYFCMLLYGLSLTGVGLLISSLCATQQQAFIGIMFFMMPSVLLSGYIAPVENMPEILQYATWINPVRHFTDIAKQIYLKGADFAIIQHSVLALVAITLFTGGLAYWLFKKNMG